MVTDTVGLDIGHTAIKAVRFRRTFGGRESVTFFQQKFPVMTEALGEEQKAQILKQFVQAHGLMSSKLMTALSCSDLFVRTLALPFHDAKKLAQVVPSEVESMIPLPLEEVAVDYQRLVHQVTSGSMKPGPASRVMVAAVQKSTLISHIRSLAEAGIDPHAIRVDALALLSFARHLGQNAGLPGDLAIIDLGASKTTICLSHQGDPWLVRTIRCGTDRLTQATTKQTVCSLVETEEQEGAGATGSFAISAAMTPSSSPDTPRRVSPRWPEPAKAGSLPISPARPESAKTDSLPRSSAFSALVGELRRTLHASEATSHTRLRSVLFCGGGAELPSLTTELGRSLELEPIGLPQRYKARWTSEYSVAFGLAVMDQALGKRIPFGAAATGSGIDLKRVMGATLAELQDRWHHLLSVGLAGLVILLLLFADLSTQMVLKQTRVQELKTVLRNEFLSKFPGMDLVTNELEQAKTTLSVIRKTTDRLGGDDPHLVPLLAELVRRLPKGGVVKLHTLTVELQTVQMEAETDSFESVEKIKAGLLQMSGVTDVSVRDARIGASPNQVLFRVTLARGS